MDECIFCRICQGEIPAAKVYDDEKFIAFLDISPANKGHALVVPKKHYSSIIEMPGFGEFMEIGQKVARAVVKGTMPDAFNLLINNGKEAGQEVSHVHLHIIPRHASDDFSLGWTHKKYEKNEMQEFSGKIKDKV